MLRTLRSCLTAVILPLLCGASAALGQGVLPTATLTVNGTEQQAGGNWDSGNIEVDFNGFVEFVGYGQYSSNASLAAALAGMFVRDYHSFGLYAKAGANGSGLSVITFQLANGSAFGPLNVFDPSVSFTLASSGFGSSTAKTADTGVATLTINGAPVAVSTYGDGSTAATIAQDLALKASSSVVAVTAEGPNLYLQAKQQGGSYSDSYSLSFSTNQSFSTSTPASGTLTGSTDAAPSVVYAYSVTNYAANGNLQNLSDSVMGTWAYNYDDLNRLTSGTPSAGPYTGRYLCWNYDSFGNRTSQSVSTTACNANPPSTFAATYSANNQISSVTAPASTAIAYDAAGNVTDDGVNTYTYDAEGRVCALDGPQGMIGYQYDADGNRVGKGTVTTITTCDITANGYTPMTDYVLDQSGGQMTEMAISGTQSSWVHSNVTANGQLIATYDNTGYGLHFYLNDPLGSRRVQTDPAGIPEQTCQSLPFGDQLYCTGSLSSPTEHHFTGKERDTESGLDYFGARYYSSNMGRFMSPDWSDKEEPVPYAKLEDPQSLNLYSYVYNNPLSRTDKDGHWPGCDWCTQVAGAFYNSFASLAEDYMNMPVPDAPMMLDTHVSVPRATVTSTSANVTGTVLSMAVPIGGEETAAARTETWLAGQIESAGSKVGNILTRQLTEDTLSAASREVSGGMGVAKSGGGTFDHVGKVEQAMAGLNRQITHAEKLLQRSGLSETQIGALNGVIEKAQAGLQKAAAAITPKPQP